MFVYLCLTTPRYVMNWFLLPISNLQRAVIIWTLTFWRAFFPLLISIKHSGKNNDLASHEKLHDVTARLFKEFLEILIFLDVQFGNVCVSRCVEKIPWLGYTRFNNILTCPPPHVRLALWVNNPVRVCWSKQDLDDRTIFSLIARAKTSIYIILFNGPAGVSEGEKTENN